MTAIMIGFTWLFYCLQFFMHRISLGIQRIVPLKDLNLLKLRNAISIATKIYKFFHG